MKKFNFVLMLSVALAVCSCSENETLPNEESTEQVAVAFLAQPEANVVVGTRSAPEDYVSANKFTFFAFKKNAEGTYNYAKTISNETAGGAQYDPETKLWSSDKSLLTVGTYRFLCMYNLGSTVTLPEEKAMKALTNMTWENIQNGIVIEHKTANADVDEFFSGEAIGKDGNVGDVNVTGVEEDNRMVVAFEDLSRVVARVDVKFVKVAVDKSIEVSYSGTNTIFGEENNLETIELSADGLAKKMNMGTAPLMDKWEATQKFLFDNMELVTIGESAVNSVFPTNDDLQDMNDTEAMRKGIVKGGAYFRGAYVLPFMTATRLTKLKIDLGAIDGSKRTITSDKDQDLKVTKNFITLVTVKLLSSTTAVTPGEPGTDEENLFNPRIKFEVTIDQKFAGFNPSDIEVE